MRKTRKQVLVVDDDAAMRSLLGNLLGSHGMSVDFAPDGDAALALIARHTYSVVLLDLLMPGTDGFAVLEKLNEVTSPPVILVITGANQSAVDSLDPRRIHGIVRKPFDPDELAALVVECAGIKSRGNFEALALAAILGSALFGLMNPFVR